MSSDVKPIVPGRTEKAPTNFFLNGVETKLTHDPAKRLIDLLRDDLTLTGTKRSCEIGRCGGCMVLVDGKAHNACLMMAYQCEGKEVVTIEGIAENELDPIQKAFLEEGGFQCGYCTPGMVVSLKAVFMEHEKPTFEQMKQGLSGNLCRCTGYGGIIRVLKHLCDGCE